MNSGTIKISTINSFKGWESEVVYLVLEEKYKTITDFNMSFDELLYTGLTRCKRNLIILNFGNQEYDLKMRPLVDKLKLFINPNYTKADLDAYNARTEREHTERKAQSTHQNNGTYTHTG